MRLITLKSRACCFKRKTTYPPGSGPITGASLQAMIVFCLFLEELRKVRSLATIYNSLHIAAFVRNVIPIRVHNSKMNITREDGKNWHGKGIKWHWMTHSNWSVKDESVSGNNGGNSEVMCENGFEYEIWNLCFQLFWTGLVFWFVVHVDVRRVLSNGCWQERLFCIPALERYSQYWSVSWNQPSITFWDE